MESQWAAKLTAVTPRTCSANSATVESLKETILDDGAMVMEGKRREEDKEKEKKEENRQRAKIQLKIRDTNRNTTQAGRKERKGKKKGDEKVELM